MDINWGYRRGGAADPRDACPYPPSLTSLVHIGKLLTVSTCIRLPDSFFDPVPPPPQNPLCCPLSKLGSAKGLMRTVFSRSLSLREARAYARAGR